MEIIKQGKKTPTNKQVYVMKCPECGCEFTYMTKDIDHEIFSSDRINCPQCESYIIVPSNRKKYKDNFNLFRRKNDKI